MQFAESIAVTDAHEQVARPEDSDLDMFGLTHVGRVRQENQDHFLLATIHPQLVMHGTSLPETPALQQSGQRLATILLVADGVGGSANGSKASRLATEAVTRYVTTTLRCYHTVGSGDDGAFIAALRAAAIDAHETVRAESRERLDGRDMATTLSLGIVVWPFMYVLQVGDSRCYLFRDDRLQQVTRDQTVAQELVDRGLLTPERALSSPLSHVLSSAIGATEAQPVVTRVNVEQEGAVILVCSDGLTKHVSDEEIAGCLRTMTSAEQACRALLTTALERGGTDNVTMVVGRTLRQAHSNDAPHVHPHA